MGKDYVSKEIFNNTISGLEQKIVEKEVKVEVEKIIEVEKIVEAPLEIIKQYIESQKTSQRQ
jgi:hypothetical protein